jgi:short-subunit dehydrogenase
MSEETLPPARPLEARRCALVIGASSGIGAALVDTLVQQGYYVAAVARREQLLIDLQTRSERITGERRVLIYAHDVANFDDIPGLFQEITTALGGLDLIIYNAGSQPKVGETEYDFAKDREMVEVNLLGAMAWLDQAAVRFSRAGRGCIVGTGSVSGDRGRTMNPGYHTTKGALAIYLESLRNRLTRHGVQVTTIKPGFVDTEKLRSSDGPKLWVISPQEAARQIVEAIHAGRQVQYVPGRWALVALVIRHIPSVIFRRLSL